MIMKNGGPPRNPENAFVISEELKEVFEEPTGVPDGNGTQHRIILRDDARPYQKVPYRMSVEQRTAMEEELGKFKERGVDPPFLLGVGYGSPW